MRGGRGEMETIRKRDPGWAAEFERHGLEAGGKPTVWKIPELYGGAPSLLPVGSGLGRAGKFNGGPTPDLRPGLCICRPRSGLREPLETSGLHCFPTLSPKREKGGAPGIGR